MKEEYSPYKIIHHTDKLNQLKNGIQTTPIQVQIVPSNACNQRCDFCFPAGTLILTEDGYLPIEDINAGIRVFDSDGNLQYVKETYNRKYVGDLIKVSISKFGVDFRCTTEHPIWIHGKEFVNADKIQIGDKIKIPIPNVPTIEKFKISDLLDNTIIENNKVRYFKSKKSIFNDIILDKDFGELCGYFLSEGHVTVIKNRPNSGAVVFTFSILETEYINRVKYLIKKIFDLTANDNIVEPTHQIVIGSKILSDLFVNIFGTGSCEKQINPALWNAPVEFLNGIWLGYLRGDGCFKDKSFSTTSLKLALSLINFAYKMGASPSLFRSNARDSIINNRILVGKHDQYTIRFRGEDRSLYSKLINESVENIRHINWEAIERFQNSVLLPIKNIERIPFDGIVYNFSVENTETYIANGIAVHNCAYRMPSYLSNQNFDESVMLSYDKIKETILSFKNMGISATQYTGGGEPLVHKRIYDIFKDTLDANIDLSLVSNGMALTDPLCELLSESVWNRISVDCSNKNTYSFIRKTSIDTFDRVINNIKTLVKYKNKNTIGVGFVVEKENYTEIYDAVKLFKDLGVDNVRISAAFTPMGYSYFTDFFKVASDLSKQAETLSDDNFMVFNMFNDRVKDTFDGVQDYSFCPMKELLAYIGADYNVYTCCTLAYNNAGLIGSIKDQTFEELWNSVSKQDKFKNHNPSMHCKHPCMYTGKNDFINYCIKQNPKHVNFI